MTRDTAINALIGALLFGTLGATTYVRTNKPKPIPVTALAVGAPAKLRDPTVVRAGREGSYLGCRIYVVFGATCPHCHRLARAEAARQTADSTPWVWVTPDTGRSVSEFAAMLPPNTKVISDSTIGLSWGIKGVPALYVVDGQEKLRVAVGVSRVSTIRSIRCTT